MKNLCGERIYNGAVVTSHMKRNWGRHSTYKAADGTIRVARRGKPYKVTPFVSKEEMKRRMKLEARKRG